MRWILLPTSGSRPSQAGTSESRLFAIGSILWRLHRKQLTSYVSARQSLEASLTLIQPNGVFLLCLLVFCLGDQSPGRAPVAERNSGQVGSPPPPGRLIDLGGYRLHLNCVGTRPGSVTVVLSAGAGDFSTDWSLVQPEVSKFTRVCSYDRSGAAWSDLGPKPRTMIQEAFDVRRLLLLAGERGPYLLVGQSLGGMIMRVFQERYPQDVAGIVLVDAYSEDSQLGINGKLERVRLQAKRRQIPGPRTSVEESDQLTPTERAQIREFIDKYVGTPKIEPPFEKLPENAQRDRIWALGQLTYYASDDDYLAEISAKMYAEDQNKRFSLGSIPLIVLTRTKYDYPPALRATLTKEHQEQQARMAKLSTRGRQILVPNSGHHIQIDAPGAVVNAIRALFETVANKH